MSLLNGKRILLGVTGSIAAYKAGELVRGLRAAGAEVRVAMTRGATEFVTPLTFQALSGHPVHEELLDAGAEAGMGHIELARWADAILVAPASADFIARLVQGRADDLLAALCLASPVPLVLAPAMNTGMWQDPATQDNVRTLRTRGVLLFGPAEGEQACGDVGPGRMLEPDALVAQLGEIFQSGALAGRTVVVTAGPTREPLDPVRFLSNRSSGRMGFAVAQAAREAGAKVILVAGPVSLPTPERVERLDVETAAEMLSATIKATEGADILVATAAVSDYRPREVAVDKIKKDAEALDLPLVRNPDVLAEVKQARPGLFCLGFAAETSRLEEHALAKLRAKGIEMIAANRVGPAAPEAGGTFDSEVAELTLYWEGQKEALPLAPKDRLARQLITSLAQRFEQWRTEPGAAGRRVVSLHATRKAGSGEGG